MKIENMEDPGRKLKILFLTNRSPLPMVDGQSRRTYNILKGLAEKHDIYLLSLFESSYEIDSKNIQHLEVFCKKVEMIRAPSKQLSFSMVIRLLRSLISIDPYTIWRHYSKIYKKRVLELVKKIDFDLIHCDILPLAYTVRNLKTPPCTITDHDVSYLKCLRMAKQCRNPLFRLLLYLEAFKLKCLEGNIFEQVDLGITVSEFDKGLLKKICPQGRLEVVENGVDTNMFKPISEKTEDNTLLWVGGFSHYPNREAIYYFLKNIYPLIKEQVYDVRLNIVGGGVTKILNRFSASDSSIKIMGYVDDPLPYIQKATVFIAPLLSGSGTKLKILEAMAAGKAIVTTSVGSEGIEGIDKEHYLIEDKPEDFAKSVIDILNDQLLKEYLGINAIKLVKEKYDWKIICEKMDIIYRTQVERSIRIKSAKTSLKGRRL